VHYLKKAEPPSRTRDTATAETVAAILADIEHAGESEVRRLNQEFDGCSDDLLVDAGQLQKAGERLPESVRADLVFARDRVREFARLQRDSMQEFEAPLGDGVVAGQRLVPVTTAGCYVPGGRYAHAASAIMSICTAKVAGVEHIIAATPAHGDVGIHPAILYAMQISGATQVIAAGGVQGIAALAFGIATGHRADIIVGPGNRFVAEAKRQLFGRIGIDVVAGPTENLIIADDTADVGIVAADLAGQAEHGTDSPVWLVTTSAKLGEAVLAATPRAIAGLPEPARSNAAEAWRDYGEIVIVDDREAACKVSDDYAPEHLQVQAADLDWWLANLKNYGSLFLGEETTVAFGDKCSGPNHILPTRGAARYSGGLSVGKFLKVLSYQRMDREGCRNVGPVAARISRLEGMEGHARTGDLRLRKYFPDEHFELEPPPLDRDPGERG
jgi:sulfopropanediol 3-dehydrogenase